jgi:hypothetical protein
MNLRYNLPSNNSCERDDQLWVTQSIKSRDHNHLDRSVEHNDNNFEIPGTKNKRVIIHDG